MRFLTQVGCFNKSILGSVFRLLKKSCVCQRGLIVAYLIHEEEERHCEVSVTARELGSG